MWIGLLFGVLYSVTEFRTEGVRPRLLLDCGPFKNGYLNFCGYHIQHWMCAVPLSILSLFFGEFDLFAFSIIMFVHGLVYSDKVGIPPAAPVVIEVDHISELSESDSDGQILNVLGADKEAV